MLRTTGILGVLLALCIGAAPAAKAPAVPDALQKAFERLDAFGLGKLASAPYVKLTLQERMGDGSTQAGTWEGWQLAADKETVSVLRQGVQPEVYKLKGFTAIPNSWGPESLELKAITTQDFRAVCKKLANTPRPSREQLLHEDLLHSPGPSYRFLIAYAAWKKGMTAYCAPIVTHDRRYEGDMGAFVASAYDDLSWTEFLRGVNLLMYANRSKVVKSLRLASRLSPKGPYAAQARELVKALEALMAAERAGAQTPVVPASTEGLKPAAKARAYIAQIKDLYCPQMGQPGGIAPYLGIVVTKHGPPPDRWGGAFGPKALQQLPTTKLRKMAFEAVPALIDALDDDTPTRTVSFWRDFDNHRTVWRVSDFAYCLLRDITKRNLGCQDGLDFTFSNMKPEQKAAVRTEARKWYESVRGMSVDDRMFTLFKSDDLDDWMTAGRYFAAKDEKRAVKPLLEKLPLLEKHPIKAEFHVGPLCELIAHFGDKSAISPIRKVMESASEPADRLDAAIALWDLGDGSGIPLAIQYATSKKQAYYRWDTPIWFLMRTRRPEAIRTLRRLVEGDPKRATQVLEAIRKSIRGIFLPESREPAGCLEIAPVLVAAMARTDKADVHLNDQQTRLKDLAALDFAILRDGPGPMPRIPILIPVPGRHVPFNIWEKDVGKRDAQIAAMRKWYEDNKDRLIWDGVHHKLALKPAPGAEQ